MENTVDYVWGDPLAALRIWRDTEDDNEEMICAYCGEVLLINEMNCPECGKPATVLTEEDWRTT